MALTFQQINRSFDGIFGQEGEPKPLSETISAILSNGYYVDILSVHNEENGKTPNSLLLTNYLTDLLENHITDGFSNDEEAVYEEIQEQTDSEAWIFPIRQKNVSGRRYTIVGNIYPLSQSGKRGQGRRQLMRLKIDGFYLDVYVGGYYTDLRHRIRILFLSNEHREAANNNWQGFTDTFPPKTQETLTALTDSGEYFSPHHDVGYSKEIDLFLDIIGGGGNESWSPNPHSFIINYTYRSPNRVN